MAYTKSVVGSFSIIVFFILSTIFRFATANVLNRGSEQQMTTRIGNNHLHDVNTGVHHKESGDSGSIRRRLYSLTNDSIFSHHNSGHNSLVDGFISGIPNLVKRRFGVVGREQYDYQIGSQTAELNPLPFNRRQNHHDVPLWSGNRVKRHYRDNGLDLNKYQILSKKELTEKSSLPYSSQRKVRHNLPFWMESHLKRRDNQDQNFETFYAKQMLKHDEFLSSRPNGATTKEGIIDLVTAEVMRQHRNKRQDDDYETSDSVDCVGPDKWLTKVVYVGLAVKLVCDPCQPVFGVSWTKQVTNKAQASMQFDSPTAADKRVVLGGDSAIYILHAVVEDQGIYRCSGDEGITSTYRLEIKNPGPMHVIRDRLLGGDGDIAIYDDNYDEHGQLSMYTAWSEWGSCSECHEGFSYGERARMGYCFAMSRTDQFPLGLPCASSEIVQEDRGRFKDRLDEKVIEACHGYCPRENPIAKNLTIYDKLLGRIDKEEPIIGYEGSYMLLECPGLEVDSAVTWHNGTRVIDAQYLSTTGGRVSIDIYDGLRIFRLEFSDGQPYHCYVEGKRRATFRVVVVSKLMDTNELLESLFYIGILILIYFLVFAIIMLAKHNIRRRQRRKKIEV